MNNKKKKFKVFLLLFFISLVFSKAQDVKIKIKEVLTIGNDPKSIIFQWVGLTTDQENSIYITDLKEYSVKKYDPDGKFIKRTGRKGQGPGEFLTPGPIQFYDGFLYIGQIQHPGIQVFDTELNYIKSIPLKQPLISFQVIGNEQIAGSMFMGNKIQLYDFKGREINAIPYIQNDDFMLNAVEFRINKENLYICFQWKDIISKLSLTGKKIWERNILKVKKVKTKKIKNFTLPQDICFKTITFDCDKNLIYVLGGHLSENASRDIYVLTQEGKWVDTITLPEPTHTIHIDSENFLLSRSEYGTLIKKFKLIFNE
ncbi:MAG TPA: hypothetical protein VFG01_08085 [Acidobacteriota bacterium]|nr:hypothetical protein [Acidobacteriota bacterium]